MTADPQTCAHLASLDAYWAGAERGENDGCHPPKPPNADVAWTVANLCTKAIGQLLDFTKTGMLPDFSADPSPESQLEAARIIDQRSRGI